MTTVDEEVLFLDRDLQWLEFNRRVLHQAVDTRTPLLERVQFLGIFTSNLDEFFMKRVGLRMRRAIAGKRGYVGEVSNPIKSIRERLLPMLEEQARVFSEEVRPQLRQAGIELLTWEELTSEERAEASTYFQDNIFSVLTPLAVDPSHPFPFLSNLSDSLAIALRPPGGGQRGFARLKIPEVVPPWIELNEWDVNRTVSRWVRTRDLMIYHLDQVFPGMEIEDVLSLRVTRSAHVELEADDAEDLRELVAEELRQRRLQEVVRLEHTTNPNAWLRDQVIRALRLHPDLVYEMPGELDYTELRSIVRSTRPELKFSDWTPQVPAALRGEDVNIFARIRGGDILLHHPYQSFDASVTEFVRAAVDDPEVVAIKMTVYRTSDDNPFVPWMIRAAEAGKQVACLVELKARFDEQRNLRWADSLEDAGVHVVYGMLGKKTHTKMILVVRREAGGLRSYVHIGTGNYNPHTARVYTDLGLLTCDPELTADVVDLFHYLTGRSRKTDYRRLLIAPINMKQRFLELIAREAEHHRAGRPARIIAKMNQLQDEDVCRALYAASQDGLPIDLIVRGFCVLRPGIPDLSPTVRVLSIVGQFLEHSRIYYFRNGQEIPTEGEFFIGSADWMHRNLEDRVESVVPIVAEDHRHHLWRILQTNLNDYRQAWDMNPDGSYTQRIPAEDAPPEQSLGTQEILKRYTLGLPLDV